MASPAPIRPVPSDVQAWRDALEAMKPTVPPCPGFSAQRWQEMREAAIDFLDRFGDDAIALGWTATDLFGVHPTVGVVRVDYCGGLMINARRVEGIGDTRIRYGNQTFRRDRPGRPVGIPVWAFAGHPTNIEKPAAASAGRATLMSTTS